MSRYNLKYNLNCKIEMPDQICQHCQFCVTTEKLDCETTPMMAGQYMVHLTQQVGPLTAY